MELTDVISAVGNTSALVLIAALFCWAYIQDKTKNQAMLTEIKEVVKALTVSNDNFAKSIEMLTKNCMQVDNKIDRNYEAILKEGKIDGRNTKQD